MLLSIRSCIAVTGYHDTPIPARESIKYLIKFEFAAK